MKSVTICITNFQSGDAVALCIESIRKYTAYPHEIAVVDDNSDIDLYGEEMDYLRECESKGWIRLMENGRRLQHGPSLGGLLETVTTDLAMIIDCDVQILAPNWLEEMVEEHDRTEAAFIANLEDFSDDNTTLQSWFFMIDMKQYPFIKDEWGYTAREDGKPGMRGTGYRLQRNIEQQGRRIVPLPASLGGRPRSLDVGASFGHPGRWHHACHISVLSFPQEGKNWEARQARYAKIQADLARLRST